MIRNLLIVAVVGFLGAVVCLTGAAVLGVGKMGNKFHYEYDWPPRDEPNSARLTREFEWDGADSLVVNLPAKVRYIQGPVARVTITAPQAILDRVKVQAGEIGVDGQRFHFDDDDIDITVQAPAVKAFRFNGGQEVDIDNYAQDTLSIEANGAAKLDVRGAARSVELRVNGAGEADLDDLVHDDAKVELNGAAKASLGPRKSVDIRINGVGDLDLTRRPPVIKQEIHGVGSVTIEENDDDHLEGRAPSADPAPVQSPAKPTTDI